MPALKLATKYVEKPWGRTTLPDAFPDAAGRQIGEVWFDGPKELHLPVLVKYIFTSERLSIQVHPNDAQGRARDLEGGKSECWLILDAEPGATLGMGTAFPLTGPQLREASLDGDIEQLMDWKPVKPGDFFYIPAGTVHAIGAGITLVEVQQNVDVTYRLYDYGRPRELHLDDGVAVSRAEPYIRPPVNISDEADRELLDRSEAPFDLAFRTLEAGDYDLGSETCWFIPLSGEGEIDGEPWHAGQCWLIAGQVPVSISRTTKALVASL